MYLLLEIKVVSITQPKRNSIFKEIYMKKYGVLLIGGRRTHQEMYAKVFNQHPLTSIVGVSDPIGTNSFRKKLSIYFLSFDRSQNPVRRDFSKAYLYANKNIFLVFFRCT